MFTKVKTIQGVRVYGPFCTVMDVSSAGVVMYCNLKADCSMYEKMKEFALS